MVDKDVGSPGIISTPAESYHVDRLLQLRPAMWDNRKVSPLEPLKCQRAKCAKFVSVYTNKYS